MATPPLSDEAMLEAIRIYTEYGSVTEAAKALDMPRQTFNHRLKMAQVKFQSGGALKSDIDNRIADGFKPKAYSHLTRTETGELIWLKANRDEQEALEAMKAAVSAINDDIDKAEPVPAPDMVDDELCNVLTFTDYHLGMYAWEPEGGADWDIHIAERIILAAMAEMIERSPKASMAIINIQGDFLHTDGKLPVTPAHKHVLDADSRFPKIRRAAIRIIRHMVAQALSAHKDVHLIIAEGNHDEESAGWLADAFAVHFEDEPRVTVNGSDLPFYAYVWGQNMIGVHHGHKVRNEALPLLFAAQFPAEWGDTTRREIHCGHRHHRDEKEFNGVTVVQHPTLAARDAYAARGGWIADRAAWSITYHKKWGPIGRVMVSPEMFIRD